MEFAKLQVNTVSDESLILFLNAAYQATLGREPDVRAVNYWTQQAKNGCGFTDILEQLINSEEHRHRTGTKLYVAPGQSGSPITGTSDVERSFLLKEKAPPANGLDGMLLDNDAILQVWNDLLPWMKDFLPKRTAWGGANYYSENDFFGPGDAAIYFAMLKRIRPKRIVSFGNRFANALVVDVLNNTSWPCTMTVIGEATDESFSVKSSKVEFVSESLEQVPDYLFDCLDRGDVLFADTSHVLKAGSELNILLFHILPRLKPGVFVQIHDIFWPFEYPVEWSLYQNRSFNENYAVRAFLMYNSSWKIEFFNHYMAVVNYDVAQQVPNFMENPGGSLWLKRI